ncbi:Legumain [Nymphon striatum]|nr:Legumain [Nymphon striatum]
MEDAINGANTKNRPIHVVLVAGSRGWGNYRHQADVLHAYQLAVSHGVPKSQIVLMAYDDIANNPKNPRKGVVINAVNGPNVYKDVLIDYSGQDVTADNFLKIIKGDSKGLVGNGTGRVLMSGPHDHVFIFMSDHGSIGFFCFPVGVSTTLYVALAKKKNVVFPIYLTAPMLNNALIEMHQKQKFGEMVIYIEACESGSMFTKLPTNIMVYANTASNATENSVACCYDKNVQAYTGDLYSVSWMKDSESRDIRKELLHTQYEATKNMTKASHVSQYGLLPLSDFSVSDFQGHVLPQAVEDKLKKVEDKDSKGTSKVNENCPDNDVVDAREVPIFTEMYKLKDAKSLTEKEEIFKNLKKILTKRLTLINRARAIFDSAIEYLEEFEKPSWEESHVLRNEDCYFPVVNHVHTKCFDVVENEYSLEIFKKFVTLCERGVSPMLIHNAIEKHCVGEKLTNTV